MSKARKVLKYTALGSITTLYGISAARILQRKPDVESVRVSQRQGAIAAAILTALTWTASLL